MAETLEALNELNIIGVVSGEKWTPIFGQRLK
jgi:hypothetical protein